MTAAAIIAGLVAAAIAAAVWEMGHSVRRSQRNKR